MMRDPDYGPVLAVGLGGRGDRGAGAGRASRWPRCHDARRARWWREAPGAGAAREPGGASRRSPERSSRSRASPLDHPEVDEIDVNPLILGDDGATAVDALVVVKGARMSEVVLYERRGPAPWITLNRPDKLNALYDALVRRPARELPAAPPPTTRCKVVVLTGAGRAFSAGFDIAEEFGRARSRAPRAGAACSRPTSRSTMQLWSLPKPTIAAVRGWCLAAPASSRWPAT